MIEIEIDCVYEIPQRSYQNYWDVSLSTFNRGNLNYNDFFKNFMLKNIPCIIKGISDNWECTNKWTNNKSINHEYFVEKYGELEVPITDCNSVRFDSICKSNSTVYDYMNYLHGDRKKLLYLKDWHLRRSCPKDIFYTVPEFFSSDWLNEYAQDNKEDDFMFVYIGPEESWTPLHSDVYNSYSWSVNVVGRKKWTMFPPGEEEKLKDRFGNVPLTFEKQCLNNIVFHEIIQEQGDAIYVPSGWYHQVFNEIDTISINHNWVNACNIEIVWNALLKSLATIENEIGEFKDTPEYPMQCQIMLKSLFGIDCASFVKLLYYIGEKRLVQLQKPKYSSYDRFILGKNHVLFDLKNIFHVIELIQNHPISIILDLQSNLSHFKSTISKALH